MDIIIKSMHWTCRLHCSKYIFSLVSSKFSIFNWMNLKVKSLRLSFVETSIKVCYCPPMSSYFSLTICVLMIWGELSKINIYQLCNFNNDSTEADKLGMNTQNKLYAVERPEVHITIHICRYSKNNSFCNKFFNNIVFQKNTQISYSTLVFSGDCIDAKLLYFISSFVLEIAYT
jgi:hypothetical protein